jgi:hypothetical protein
MSPSASPSLSARTRNPTASSPPPALPVLDGTVLRVLYQHRIATTGQLQQLLAPDAADASYLRRVLRKAAAAGLVDAVRRGSAGHRAWFLTGAGYAAAEASGEVEIRAHRMTPALAAGGLLAHRLAVVDTGIAFVTAARRTPGDGCTPWAWAPEVLLQLLSDRLMSLACDRLLSLGRCRRRHSATIIVMPRGIIRAEAAAVGARGPFGLHRELRRLHPSPGIAAV